MFGCAEGSVEPSFDNQQSFAICLLSADGPQPQYVLQSDILPIVSYVNDCHCAPTLEQEVSGVLD